MAVVGEYPCGYQAEDRTLEVVGMLLGDLQPRW